jgi:signal transduction histidine kinase
MTSIGCASTNLAHRARASTGGLIRDDGVGGADSGGGSGLVGLRDRVEALGGTMQVLSPPGEGTSLQATVPFDLDTTSASR